MLSPVVDELNGCCEIVVRASYMKQTTAGCTHSCLGGRRNSLSKIHLDERMIRQRLNRHFFLIILASESIWATRDCGQTAVGSHQTSCGGYVALSLLLVSRRN